MYKKFGMEATAKKEIMRELRERIMVLEGFKGNNMEVDRPEFGLGAMEPAFPRGVFPTGAVHEFVSPTAASACAANGFISGLLSPLIRKGMYCLWISTCRSLFPPGLNLFGISPDQIVFVDVKSDRDALWVMEQGLKCEALAAVVAELGEVSFAESQRLQLAVEKSRVTGFLHRKRPRRGNSLACVSRWKIRPVSSELPDDLPGIGHPTWVVQLEKMRNGKPSIWHYGWRRGKFVHMPARRGIRTEMVGKERYA